MLPWKQVWALPDPASTMCEAWNKASMLSPPGRRRAREKIERFLFSSTLLYVRPITIRVKCRSTYARHCARQMFEVLRYHYTQMWGDSISRFLIRKGRVLQQKPGGVHEQTGDNIKLARKFEKTQYQAIPEENTDVYRTYKDVRLEQYQCNTPGFNDEAVAISQIWRSCTEATEHMQNPLLQEDLWQTAEHLCGTLGHGTDHTKEIVQYIREQTQYRTLSIVDRDPARRASMEQEGYIWRLYDHFSTKPHLYREIPGISPEGIANVRQGLAVACLPKRYWRKKWEEQSTPFAYLTYKGKCFDDTGAWCCKSSHCHMREIISYAGCPSSPYLSTIARCIRTIHRALVKDDRLSFVLWNQSNVTEALHRKVAFLRPHRLQPGQCPCGCKFDRLQVIKTDATAFFTLVNRTRCLEEIRDSIKKLERQDATGIILHRELHNISKVLYKGKRPPRTHKYIPFGDVYKALDYLALDKFFLVGDIVYERLDGLAMGNATSPPTTSFDLDHHSRRIYTDKEHAKTVGAYVPGIPTARVLQSLLHVDDCITFSKIFCEECLARIIKALWPRDVEAKVEEQGADVDFLHCHIRCAANSINTNNILVTPLTPNLLFCQGKTLVPKFAKGQQFVAGVHRRGHLNPILWGKFAIITNTCKQNYLDAKQAIICNIVECILLGWCPKDTGIAAANFPKSHRNTTSNCIRLLGQIIKKSHDINNAWRISSTHPRTWLGYPWFETITKTFDYVAHRMQK